MPYLKAEPLSLSALIGTYPPTVSSSASGTPAMSRSTSQRTANDDDDELDGLELELEPELCDERDEDDDREELGLLDELEPGRDELDELLDMNAPLSRAGTTEPYR